MAFAADRLYRQGKTGMDDPYKTLGVSKTATADEIRKAYRKLAKELHPDSNPGNAAAEERFKHVSQAFKLLSDPEKRAEYDAAARAGFHPGMGGMGGMGGGPGGKPFNFRQSRHQGRGGFEDIFSDLFTDFGGQGGGGRQRQAPRKGADVRQTVTVDFMQAAQGGKHRVSLPGGRTLDVAVPSGASDGQLLRLRGQGEASAMGGEPGDALIEIKVAEHKFFRARAMMSVLSCRSASRKRRWVPRCACRPLTVRLMCGCRPAPRPEPCCVCVARDLRAARASAATSWSG